VTSDQLNEGHTANSMLRESWLARRQVNVTLHDWADPLTIASIAFMLLAIGLVSRTITATCALPSRQTSPDRSLEVHLGGSPLGRVGCHGPDERTGRQLFPFNVTCYLYGHSFVAQEIQRIGVQLRKADDAFLAVSDVSALQMTADHLTLALLQRRCNY
jgi:hypothetical protein